ncbi:hypothetical protein ACW69I_11440 [Streptomyces sp. MN12]
MERTLTECLLLAAFMHRFVVIQRKFDAELAEAQRAIAVATGAAPARALRLVDANEALEELSSRRFAAQAVTPSNALMEQAMMLFAPFIQSAGRANREAMSMFSQGIARIMLSAAEGSLEAFVNAQRKLASCDAFDEGEVGGLIVISASRMVSTFEGSFRWLKRSFREAREAFVKETDKHLDSHLPVSR